jgi:hypothetical protein
VLRLRELTALRRLPACGRSTATALLCAADETELSRAPVGANGLVDVELTPYGVVTLALRRVADRVPVTRVTVAASEPGVTPRPDDRIAEQDVVTHARSCRRNGRP